MEGKLDYEAGFRKRSSEEMRIIRLRYTWSAASRLDG